MRLAVKGRPTEELPPHALSSLQQDAMKELPPLALSLLQQESVKELLPTSRMASNESEAVAD